MTRKAVHIPRMAMLVLLLLYYMIALTIPFIKCHVPEVAEFAAPGGIAMSRYGDEDSPESAIHLLTLNNPRQRDPTPGVPPARCYMGKPHGAACCGRRGLGALVRAMFGVNQVVLFIIGC
jgi:hypothetical protein